MPLSFISLSPIGKLNYFENNLQGYMVNNTNICYLLITVIFTEVSCSIMPGIIWFAEYINNNKLELNSLHILYLIVKQFTSLTRSFQSLLQREIIFCLQILAFSITWKKKKIKNLVGFVKKMLLGWNFSIWFTYNNQCAFLVVFF